MDAEIIFLSNITFIDAAGIPTGMDHGDCKIREGSKIIRCSVFKQDFRGRTIRSWKSCCIAAVMKITDTVGYQHAICLSHVHQFLSFWYPRDFTDKEISRHPEYLGWRMSDGSRPEIRFTLDDVQNLNCSVISKRSGDTTSKSMNAEKEQPGFFSRRPLVLRSIGIPSGLVFLSLIRLEIFLNLRCSV